MSFVLVVLHCNNVWIFYDRHIAVAKKSTNKNLTADHNVELCFISEIKIQDILNNKYFLLIL